MTKTIWDVDFEVVMNLVAGSEGNLDLVAERLNGLLEQPYGTIKEYDVKARMSQMDQASADSMAARFRALMIIKIYDLVVVLTDNLKGCIDDLKPADLVKAHASTLNAFNSLTSNAVKVAIDVNGEIDKIIAEFPEKNLSRDEIKANIKEMEKKLSGKL